MSSDLFAAAGQVWPAFVLVAGLLLIGSVLESENVFAAVGARVERIGGSPTRLLAALLGLEAVVTALLNLDTAVVFLTPVMIHAARRRDCDERPFLYGALLMANGASLLLPGSNLTNLIVLSHARLSGAAFAHAMALPWLIVVAATIAFVALVFRPHKQNAPSGESMVQLELGVGVLATAVSVGLIVALRNPALPVLSLGLAATAARRLRPRLDARVLAGLFVIAVALGALGRRWHAPARLLGHAGGVGAAAIGAVASVAINNLPAAALLSAQTPPKPLPLLIGLNLGPNLALTGSLSYYLWFVAARSTDSRPSVRTATLLGLVLVPLTIAGALAALALVRPHAL